MSFEGSDQWLEPGVGIYVNEITLEVFSSSPDALLQQKTCSHAHPELSPGHMRMLVSGGAEEGEPERVQKVKSLLDFQVFRDKPYNG